MEKKYMRCSVCGQIIEVVKDSGAPLICCGEVMEEIKPEVDEKLLGEKHIPVYKIRNGDILVKIGSIPHPSTKEHYIEWITLVTSKGAQTRVLKPGDTPEAIFALSKDEIVTDIYAFCNIHSLWKVRVRKDNKTCGCELDLK